MTWNTGSDRSCDRWYRDYVIDGINDLSLHHLYRAMAFLGEEFKDQKDCTPFAPRCTKDVIEEDLFLARRDLFSGLDCVFFDTTSICFEGSGGETIGELGHSKDHRPDLRQMVVGGILDNHGQPVCSEMWPGNTADVTTLVPVIKQLRSRFAIERICIVSDRGMISAETMTYLEEENLSYILGARMRRNKEVKEEVLSRVGRYREVYPEGNLVIRKELDRRLEKAGYCFEWADIKQDLKALQEITIKDQRKTLAIRRECYGTCGKVFQAVGPSRRQSGRSHDAIHFVKE